MVSAPDMPIRPPCRECSIKHAGKANAKITEIIEGYSEENDLQAKLTVGELAEAEEECISGELKNRLRIIRRELWDLYENNGLGDIAGLMEIQSQLRQVICEM